jgi:hypothetical protein
VLIAATPHLDRTMRVLLGMHNVVRIGADNCFLLLVVPESTVIRGGVFVPSSPAWTPTRLLGCLQCASFGQRVFDHHCAWGQYPNSTMPGLGFRGVPECGPSACSCVAHTALKWLCIEPLCVNHTLRAHLLCAYRPCTRHPLPLSASTRSLLLLFFPSQYHATSLRPR